MAEDIFLACFAFGALFTIVSVVLGIAGAALHAPQAGHVVHHTAGGPENLHAHADIHAHGGAEHGAHDGDGHTGHGTLPLLNASSLLAFLTWFGAAGYLLLRFAHWPLPAAAGAAVAAGGAGALLVAFFLTFVLAGEREMDPRDYRLEGTIARVSVTIPAGGTGEIVFSMAGSRRGEAARSLSGRPIARDTEVVIIDYAHGVAAVQPWEEFVAGSRFPGRGSEAVSGSSSSAEPGTRD